MSPFAPRTWWLAHGRSLTLGPRGLLMGILNVTPDSFSDGGANDTIEAAVNAALAMIDAGAAIIDVGGESTRPGAAAVDGEEEMRRVLPVIRALVERSGVPISIDTYRASTAAAALHAGACIVNDVTGLRGDPAMRDVAADTGLIAMHNSRPDVRRAARSEPVADQHAFARELESSGIAPDRIVVDPGIGFGKDAALNLHLLARLDELCTGPFPLLLGTSRKRFIGTVIGRDVDARDVGTAATTALGRRAGAAIFRVHDIPANRDALRMADAIRTGSTVEGDGA